MANKRMDRDFLMRQAQKGNVGFRQHGSRQFLHLWLSEHEKRPLTRDEKDSLHYLLSMHYLHPVHAIGAFGRGVFEPTRYPYSFTTPEPDVEGSDR